MSFQFTHDGGNAKLVARRRSISELTSSFDTAPMISFQCTMTIRSLFSLDLEVIEDFTFTRYGGNADSAAGGRHRP